MALKYAGNQLTIDGYLAGEQDAQTRHELIDGEVFAMTGASDKHNKISGNVFTEIKTRLKSKQSPCSAYINDMKVKVQNDFYYPDIMVVCDQQDNESDYYKTRPVIIIEVLSSTTRKSDKTRKRKAYQSIESLQEYCWSNRIKQKSKCLRGIKVGSRTIITRVMKSHLRHWG